MSVTSVLSDGTIRRLVDEGRIVIRPWDPAMVQPASIDLRLGDSIRPAWYRQDLAQVPQDKSLYDITADLRPMWNLGAIQSHLGAFGFSGDTVLRRAGSLSGSQSAASVTSGSARGPRRGAAPCPARRRATRGTGAAAAPCSRSGR